MDEPILGKAMDTKEFLKQNAEARRLHEMRQKALHDEASMLEGAKEEGEHNKAVEVAFKLLNKEMDIESIADITGLSKDEVRNLRHNIN